MIKQTVIVDIFHIVLVDLLVDLSWSSGGGGGGGGVLLKPETHVHSGCSLARLSEVQVESTSSLSVPPPEDVPLFYSEMKVKLKLKVCYTIVWVTVGYSLIGTLCYSVLFALVSLIHS